MNQHVPRPGKAERPQDNGERQQQRSERSADGVRLKDVKPLPDIPALWRVGAIVATQIMGMLALIAALYFGRTILLPVVSGMIVGITLSPAVKSGSRVGLPPALSAVIIVMLAACIVGAVLTFFAAPLTEWIGRAPEIGKAVQEKLHVLDYPLSIFRDIKTAIMPAATSSPTVAVEHNPAEIVGAALVVITPALGQFVVFFGTLIFFLATNDTLRQKLVVAFVTHDGRLRMLRIWTDIEENLVGYVGLVTLINIGLGTITAAVLYLIGFPNPLTFGLLTVVLNYVPYLGPAIVALTLFGVGIVAMPTLPQAALAPALFVVIATAEGHFITPSIVGRRLTLSPFLVFLALAFWTWLWGPVGAFLAVPLVIVSYVVFGHLWPEEESSLPG
jgi:predicted PurR-regulated permease PerM